MILSFIMANTLPLIFLAVCIIVIGYLIPFDGYKISVQFAGIVLLTTMVFFAGKSSERDYWKNQAIEAELEISYLRAKSSDISTEIVTKYVDKVRIIERNRDIPVSVYVNNEDSAKCVINEGFVKHYNSIVENVTPTASVTDRNSSSVTLVDLSETNKQNLTAAKLAIEQVKSLQEWIKAQQQLFNQK